MTVLTSDSSQSEVAQLLTPEFTSTAEMCVRFWWVQICTHTHAIVIWSTFWCFQRCCCFRYWIPAGPSHSLSVHVMRSGETGDALWQRSGAPSSGWEVAEVTVASPAKFYVSMVYSHNWWTKGAFTLFPVVLFSETVHVPHQVVFKAFHVPGSDSAVKLDDVSVRDGPCSPSGSCDFESGSCNWMNIHREGGHDWVLANGGFQGPLTDHTTQTPEGKTVITFNHQFNTIITA